jgi:hypothetical protein
MFLKTEDDDHIFSREMPSDGLIEIGQDLQLRASVRPGDGLYQTILCQ